MEVATKTLAHAAASIAFNASNNQTYVNEYWYAQYSTVCGEAWIDLVLNPQASSSPSSVFGAGVLGRVATVMVAASVAAFVATSPLSM